MALDLDINTDSNLLVRTWFTKWRNLENVGIRSIVLGNQSGLVAGFGGFPLKLMEFFSRRNGWNFHRKTEFQCPIVRRFGAPGAPGLDQHILVSRKENMLELLCFFKEKISHYKDPYEPIRSSWHVMCGFCCRCSFPFLGKQFPHASWDGAVTYIFGLDFWYL